MSYTQRRLRRLDGCAFLSALSWSHPDRCDPLRCRYDAAQIYRKWATKHAVWTRKGSVATRLANNQLPHYLTTTPLLIESNVGNPRAHPNDTVASMVEIMRLLDVKEMITWWSGWNQEYFDAKYPQFTPRSGFVSTAAMACQDSMSAAFFERWF